MRMTALLITLLGSVLALALPSIGFAQASRTWVSGVGDDANPCSRTAPCKTLAGTISKTAAGGIINLIDDAAVGAVTITKSITIQAKEEFAGVLHSGSNGVIINAAATDTVVLSGLSIHGFLTGLNGVRILSAGTVRIERCDIQSSSESGIEVASANALKLSVQDTSIENILASAGSPDDGAILLKPTGAGAVRAVFDRVRIHGINQVGINAIGNVRFTLRDSIISDVNGTALRLDGTTGATQGLVENSSLVESTNGIFAQGSGAVVRVSGSSVTGNGQGLQINRSAQIISFGNNVFAGNSSDGGATSTVPTQ